MNTKQIGVLAVLALAAIGAANASLRTGPQGLAGDRRGEPVFANLVPRLNDVASVTIADSEKSFTVERRENGFFEKDSGYPVKADAFRDILVGAATLAYEETKTADPARYGDLGLGEVGGAPDTVGRQVTIRDGRGQVMAAVIVGARDATVGGARGGLYIRLPEQKQTFVVRGEVRAPAPHAAWFETNVTNIGRDALASVTLTGGGLDEIKAASEKKGDDLKLLNAPEDKDGDSSKIMRLSFMVDPISFQDVRKQAGAPAADARRMIVTARNGVQITYTVVGAMADGWVRFAVEATSEEGRAEAADLKTKLEGFDFKLAPHEIDMLGWALKDVTTERKG